MVVRIPDRRQSDKAFSEKMVNPIPLVRYEKKRYVEPHRPENLLAVSFMDLSCKMAGILCGRPHDENSRSREIHPLYIRLSAGK